MTRDGRKADAAFARRTLITVGLIFTLTVATTLWWTWNRDRARLDESQQTRALRTAELAHLLLQKRLQATRSFVRAVATSGAIREAIETRNQPELLAAIQAFREDFATTYLVIDDLDGRPIAWSTATAMISLGLAGPVPPDMKPSADAALVTGDVSVIMAEPIEADSRVIGRVRGAALIGRIFIRRTSSDLEAPLALYFGDELMHHNFPADPPPPADPEPADHPRAAAPRFRVVSLRGEPFDIAYRPIGGMSGEAWLAAGLPRGSAEASIRRFMWLMAGLGGGGLAVVLVSVGSYLTIARQRERIALQRDAAVHRSRGLSDRLAHLAAVVHDIKAPVGGIQLRCEALLEQEGPPELRPALTQISDTCDRLLLYLANVLTAAQADEGSIPIRRESVLLPGLLEEVREKIAPLAERRGVELACEADDSAPSVIGDTVLLERALLNLASNAVAATPAGGTVCLFTGRRDGHLAIGVRDTGRGFSSFAPEQAFARERPQVKDHSLRTGSGLGLYIVARIAEAHGGRALAENRSEGGAEVMLLIPPD